MGFYAARVQGKNTLKDTMRRIVIFLFIKRGKKLFDVERNLVIQGNICESKIKKTNNKIL